MKTLFTIAITVTRPYGTTLDDDIKKYWAGLFAEAFQDAIKIELTSLGIVGLNVTVKVK